MKHSRFLLTLTDGISGHVLKVWELAPPSKLFNCWKPDGERPWLNKTGDMTQPDGCAIGAEIRDAINQAQVERKQSARSFRRGEYVDTVSGSFDLD